MELGCPEPWDVSRDYYTLFLENGGFVTTDVHKEKLDADTVISVDSTIYRAKVLNDGRISISKETTQYKQ